VILEYPTQAITQTRRLLGLPASDAGSAWRVRRLAAPGAYFIVHVDGRVACVEATTGALMSSGESAQAPVRVTREAAQATLGAGAFAELVWKPCAASMSMFDPLWLVTRGHDSLFFDQRGKRWPTLPEAAPG